jgi:hypothetical protein
MRAVQPTLIDLFELPADPKEYVPPPRAASARQSIDLEIDWEAVRREPVEEVSGVRLAPRAENDWNSSTEGSTPGVSCESWHRARGWCEE